MLIIVFEIYTEVHNLYTITSDLSSIDQNKFQLRKVTIDQSKFQLRKVTKLFSKSHSYHVVEYEIRAYVGPSELSFELCRSFAPWQDIWLS